MKSKVINIDIYCENKSSTAKQIDAFLTGEKKFNYTFKNANNLSDNQNADVLLFEEEDSYLISYELIKEIITHYEKKPIIIILTENNDIFNVVQWMRYGVTDCLLVLDFNKKNLLNSIEGSLDFVKTTNKKSITKTSLNIPRVEIPQKYNWNEIKDNSTINMTLVMIVIDFKKDAVGKYSGDSQKTIYNKIKIEIANLAKSFAGRLWYWSNNFGVLSFHFGDKVNCGVLSAISIYYRFFLICLETLKLEELLDFKVSIHSGTGLYNKNDTGQITSDLINSLSHLAFKHTNKNELCITQDVYKNISERIKPSFNKSDNFENRDIYTYSLK